MKLESRRWSCPEAEQFVNFMHSNLKSLSVYNYIGFLSFNVIKHYWSIYQVKLLKSKSVLKVPQISKIISAISCNLCSFIFESSSEAKQHTNELQKYHQKIQAAQQEQRKKTNFWTKIPWYTQISDNLSLSDSDDDIAMNDKGLKYDFVHVQNSHSFKKKKKIIKDTNDVEGDDIMNDVNDVDGDDIMNDVNDVDSIHKHKKKIHKHKKRPSPIRSNVYPRTPRKKQKINDCQDDRKYATSYWHDNDNFTLREAFNYVVERNSAESTNFIYHFDDIWFPLTHDDKKKFGADPESGMVIAPAFIQNLSEMERVFLDRIYNKNKGGL